MINNTVMINLVPAYDSYILDRTTVRIRISNIVNLSMHFTFSYQAHQQTTQLYEQTFGEVYAYPGCSYRGLPPKHFMIEETDAQRTAVSTLKFRVTLQSMKVNLSNIYR